MILSNKKDNKYCKNKPIILDGAIGNYLEVIYDDIKYNKLWATELNFTKSELLIDMYSKYIDAGANIITTNTFRTNPTSLKHLNNLNLNKYGITNNIQNNLEICIKQAVDICRNSINKLNNKSILIAGSNSPAEDCYSKNRTLKYETLKDNHINHINCLVNNKVDLILNETQSHMDEIDIIMKHIYNSSINSSISLYLDNSDGVIKCLDGNPIEKVIEYLLGYNFFNHNSSLINNFISFNCISIDTLKSILNNNYLRDNIFNYSNNINWGFYLNHFDYYNINDVKLIIKNYKPYIVGGCCYTNPEYIQQISNVFYYN